MINHLVEAEFSFRRLAQGKPANVRVGEVVVLANAFEFAPAEATAEDAKQASFMFTPDPKRMKVVYYSDDVQDKQGLNFSNIPLKVETEYGGRPIGIQITVIELDRMGTQLQGLLRTLADLGKQSNAIPGGQAGALLAELGTSLMTGSHDDMMFDYLFVLDPGDVKPSVQHAAFEEGRYVLRRQDSRGADANWRNLKLDLNTGKVWKADNSGAFVMPFVDETYFTVNVIKHPKDGIRSKYALQTMEQLSEELKARTTDLDQAVDDLNKGIQTQSRKMRGAKWDAELTTAWGKARNQYLAHAQMLDPKDMSSGCTIPDETKRKRSETGMAAKSAALDFIEKFHKARAEKMGTEVVFTDAEQRQLLATLGSYFLPEEQGAAVTAADLIDPAKFETKFPKGGADFYKAMDAAALEHWRTKTCAEMVGFGLAVAAPLQPQQTPAAN